MITTDPLYVIESASKIDGTVDIVLYDSSSTFEFRARHNHLLHILKPNVVESELISFDVNDMTARACDMIIDQSISLSHDKTVMIYGCGKIGKLIAQKLITRGFKLLIVGRSRIWLESIRDSLKSSNEISLLAKNDKHFHTKLRSLCENTDVIVSSVPSGNRVISLGMVEKLPDDCLIIDLGINTIYPHAIETANRLQKKMIRLDIIAAFHGELKGILETRKLIKNIKSINTPDATYVSGGYIGKRGDIVLRNINDKTSVIGIADGRGGIVHD